MSYIKNYHHDAVTAICDIDNEDYDAILNRVLITVDGVAWLVDDCTFFADAVTNFILIRADGRGRCVFVTPAELSAMLTRADAVTYLNA